MSAERTPQSPPPAVAFVAWSGTGKTTLMARLIALASSRGLTVGALKHDAHEFSIDRPGKDSYRFTEAGAMVTGLVSATRSALVRKHDQAPGVDKILARDFHGVDLVLVEGWKNSDLPRIEVFRPDLGRPLLSRGERHELALLAVASDGPVEVDVPVLDLNEPAAILDFICQRFGLV